MRPRANFFLALWISTRTALAGDRTLDEHDPTVGVARQGLPARDHLVRREIDQLRCWCVIGRAACT